MEEKGTDANRVRCIQSVLQSGRETGMHRNTASNKEVLACTKIEID